MKKEKLKIQIDGTNTINKGAELMLYAILQEIEKRYPEAEVIFNEEAGEKPVSYIATKLNIRRRVWCNAVFYRLHVVGIFRRLHLPYSVFTSKYPTPDVDILLDAGGFQFSDQWKMSDVSLNNWLCYLEKMKQYGTKIIYLPQAFGPFETLNGRACVEMLNKYADQVFAREETSYQYLLGAGMFSSKLFLYPDFTSLVNGVIPEQYRRLAGSICLIPNMRIIDQNVISKSDYYSLFLDMVEECREHGKNIFLLNHEGKGDETLCYEMGKTFNIPVVSGLNALEIKGLISIAYLVVSSRFHGVASALTSAVPCLATSWSHKYEMLFKDFNQKNCVLDIKNRTMVLKQFAFMLDKRNNDEVRNNLILAKKKIQALNHEMWDLVWSCVE